VGGFGLVFTVAGLLIWFVAVPSASGSNTSGLTRHLQAPGLWESVEQGEG
jgi:hypothetical protein